jgi:hypothetical protein
VSIHGRSAAAQRCHATLHLQHDITDFINGGSFLVHMCYQ